ncbi:MAG: hypothetical protein ACRD9Q_07750 [Nitrososphaeraceae archaeon]
MSQSLEILRELADMIVNASFEERKLTAVECEYFDVMFEKTLKLSNP